MRIGLDIFPILDLANCLFSTIELTTARIHSLHLVHLSEGMLSNIADHDAGRYSKDKSNC